MDAELAVGGDAKAWGNMTNNSFGDSNVDLKEFVENQYDEICYEYVTDKVFLLDVKQWINITENEEILGESFNIFKSDDLFGKRYIGLRTPYGWRYIYSGHGESNPSGESIMFPFFEEYSNSWKTWIVKAGNEAIISPAFYLDESAAQILSGSGTEEDPYVVDGKQIGVYVNGTELTLDVPPMLENDRTLVPMRAIFEALGAEVSWYPEDRTIVAVRGGTTVFMQVNDWYMSVNDEWIALDAPPRIVNDRTLIPLRAVAEALGAQVGWDEEMQVVTVELE